MLIRCVDVESTGLDPAKGAGVCEIGWTDVNLSSSGDVEVGRPTSVLVNPGHKIPPECSAVHHLIDADVALAPTFELAEQQLRGADILCAHHAEFERKFILMPANWICTWKVALTLAPMAPAHNLQTLRYWLKLVLDKDEADPPHRAGPDSYVCAHLLARMLAKMTATDMVRISSAPVVLSKLQFGMHAGKPIAELPASYLEWMLRPEQKEMDENARHTAFTELNRRRTAKGAA